MKTIRDLSPHGKVLKISKDPASPLNSELSQFLASLPPEVIEAAYADSIFVELHGKNEDLARVWCTERLLIEEAARIRLRSLAELPPSAKAMPYSADCLRDVS
jgi:hypothetical protein